MVNGLHFIQGALQCASHSLILTLAYRQQRRNSATQWPKLLEQLEFIVLLKDTSTCKLKELGAEPQTT